MKFKFLVPVAGLITAIANQYAHAAVETPQPISAAPIIDMTNVLALNQGGEQVVTAGGDNYVFVLKRSMTGEMMAFHQSHSSHGSHSSHDSHSSHYSHRSGS